MSNQAEQKIVVVSRDVMGMLVPAGARIMIHQGTEVRITQALGNSFTVNLYGNLARIDGKDADAIGQKIVDPLKDLPEDATLEDKVWAQLKMVFDPEIPINIVDLGLVYNTEIQSFDKTSFYVTIIMTLTAPGCGMGPVIAEDAKQRIEMIPEVKEAHVDIVFEPPWDRSMMSDTAKLELGMMW